MQESISVRNLQQFEKAFYREPSHVVAMNAATANNVFKASRNPACNTVKLPGFSVEVEAGKVCNQKQSGRCWMFASLNLMRMEIMQRFNIENMELSQAYPFFFDKLEKSNHFLENILETLDEETDSRVVQFLLQDPVGDGGQWDMFRSLIDKYGVVPQDIMPDTAACENSSEMNNVLCKKLRGFACRLRAMHQKGARIPALRKEKEAMMETIYRILTICLGTPPKVFTWEFRNKDKKFKRIADITPQDFFKKYIGWKLDDYVTVIHAPTEDKEYGQTYTVRHLGNVRGGKYPVKYLNLPIEQLKKLAIAQLKDGRAVWFGSDVGQFSDRAGGFLTLDAYRMDLLFDTDFPMTKAERLDHAESMMTHAMAITGVNLDKSGHPTQWKVENSWGKDRGKDGYYLMSDAWFDEYVYQILLDRHYFNQTQSKQFDKEPVVLKPWDPFGSLALRY
ncbi:MAG: C1 family peptidase [Lachnospiraceae bacterium]|nr:C1 family peptidase [Lachnospiraceae bacterium]